jgi:hypothetical protein
LASEKTLSFASAAGASCTSALAVPPEYSRLTKHYVHGPATVKDREGPKLARLVVMFRFDADKRFICDGYTRRDFLHAGSLGLLGFGLNCFLY